MLICFSICLTGCSDPAKEMRLNQEFPDWPELQKLQSDEILMPVGTAIDFGDMNSAKQELKNPGLKAALDAFEASSIPSGFDTEERKAAKEKAVKSFREAIELAESNGSSDKIKTAYEQAQEALRTVSAPLEN